MALIHDMEKKIREWQPTITITAEDHAEKLTCSICGKTGGFWDFV